jgi:sugar lactone lactonase YvrE/type II secretory pathway pseudopilin PulG
MRIPARSRLGFSLTELVAVLLVTLVLAAVAVPTYRAVTAEVRQDAVTTSAKALRNHLDALAAEEQVPTSTYDPTIELGLYNEDPEKITAAEYSSSEILVTGVYGSDFYYACITLAETVGGTSSVADGHCDTSMSLTTQTITFPQPYDALLSEGSRILSASASSGLSVEFASSTLSVCTVVLSTAVLHALGTCTITASQSGGDGSGTTFAPAPPVTRSFSVLSGDGEPFPLTATPGNAETTLSFDPVVGAISYAGYCWTADLGEENARSGSLTATGADPENLRVGQLENLVVHTCKVYADTGEFSETVSVMPAAAPADECPDVELGFDPDLCSPGVEPSPDPDCPDGPITTPVAGCDSGEEIEPDYSQEITFLQPDDQPLSAEWVTVVAASSSGLSIILESDTTAICLVSGFTVTLLAAGSCRLTASQSGGTLNGVTYTPAAPATRAFQIYDNWNPDIPPEDPWGPPGPAQVIYFPAPGDRVVGSPPFLSGALASSGLTVILTSATGSVCATGGLTITVLSAGTCRITATQAGGTAGGVTYSAATPVTRIFQVRPSGIDGGGVTTGNILDVTNHFAHDGDGPHHIFFGSQNRFGYTRDHSSLGPNYLFETFPLNTYNDGTSMSSFANPSALAYGNHPSREDEVPGTEVEALYLADANSGKIYMVLWNAKRAYQIAHGFNRPSGISWSACVNPDTGVRTTIGNTSDCLYVADADGVWMTPLEYRCTTSCGPGYRQPAFSISRSNTLVVEVISTPVQRVFAAANGLWTTQPDRIVRYSYTGAVVQTVTGVAPYGIVHVPGQGAFFTDLVDHKIKKVTATPGSGGVVTTIAGSGLAAFGDGTGNDASFRSPHGITYHGNPEYLYVADTGNNAIRRVDWETGEVLTMLRPRNVTSLDVDSLPTASSGDGTNGIGTAPQTVVNLDWYGTSALSLPGLRALARDGSNLYLLSSTSGLYRYNLASGTTTQLIAWVDQTVTGGAVVVGGNLYYGKASSIERINLTTLVRTTYAGVSSSYGSDDGIGTAARFAGYVGGLTTDGTYLYTTTQDGCTKCKAAIRRINLATAEVTTLLTHIPVGSSTTQYWKPSGIVYADGSLYVGTRDYGILAVDPLTASVSTVSEAGSAYRLAADSTYLYASAGSTMLVRIHRLTGEAEALATYGNGLGFNVQVHSPTDLTMYDGDLYVADTGNNRLLVLSEEPRTTTSEPSSSSSSLAITDAYGSTLLSGIERPSAITYADGYLYVLAISDGIHRVDPATGASTKIFSWVDHTVNGGVVVVGGNLYYSSKSMVYRVDLSALTRVQYAGRESTYGTADGIGTGALFNGYVGGLTTDGTYLYVADTGSCGSVCYRSAIRKINLVTAEVTTLVEALPDGYRFWKPNAVTYTGGYLYVGTESRGILQVDPDSGAVSTLAGSAGSGLVDGDAATARLSTPTSMVADADHLYFTQGSTVRRTNLATGYTRTIASGSGSTVGEDTLLSSGIRLTSDGSALVVADHGNDRLVRFTQTPFTSSADTGTASSALGFVGSANGSAQATELTGANAVTAAGGQLYYLTTGSGIYRGDGTVVLSWSALTVNGGATSDGRAVFYTRGAAIYRFDLVDGTTSVFAGSSSAGSVNAVAGSARFSSPTGLTTDGMHLYVADTGNNAIRKVNLASGSVTTLLTGVSSPRGITYTGGYLYVGAGPRILRVDPVTGASTVLSGTTSVGNVDGSAATTRFGAVFGLTTDGSYLYATDSTYHTVRRVTIADGNTATLAGNGSPGSALGSDTRLNAPRGITLLGASLYVADSGNGRIVRLDS